MSANPYRGEIRLALPSGELLAVIDANALRLLMEELNEHDLDKTLKELQTHALDRIPRLLYHGVRSRIFLTGADEEPPKWEAFAAQVGQLDFTELIERVGHALSLGDDEEQKKTESKGSGA